MGVLRSLLIAALVLLLGPAAAGARANDFSDWAAVVVAGDWRAANGRDTEAFDNARRDLSAALVRAGFSSANLRQYSLRPVRPGDDPDVVVEAPVVAQGLLQLTRDARGGCLFYVTSHGSPYGAVFGPDMLLQPPLLDQLLTEACGERPTVAVISACYSGVFVQALSRPNRMILTAARPDRSSFGCSERDRYPYFDACVLESLPQTRDFVALSHRVKTCVARLETQQGLAPPSEPQTAIGSQAQITLPFLRFAGP